MTSGSQTGINNVTSAEEREDFSPPLFPVSPSQKSHRSFPIAPSQMPRFVVSHFQETHFLLVFPAV